MRECGISQRVITRLLAWIQERWVLQKCWWLRPVFRTLGKSGLQNETAISQFAPPLACLPPTWLPCGQPADRLCERVWQPARAPCVPQHAGAACAAACAPARPRRASQARRPHPARPGPFGPSSANSTSASSPDEERRFFFLEFCFIYLFIIAFFFLEEACSLGALRVTGELLAEDNKMVVC